MRETAAFLKERKRDICLYAVFLGIFAVIFHLYNIRMDAVRYAFLLSAVWLLLFGIPDYIRYRRKHRELSEMEQKLASGLDDMPEPSTLAEESYQKMLAKLYGEKMEIESAGRIGRQEMVDYYSMWVHQIKTPIAAMHVMLQALDSCQPERPDGTSLQYAKEMKLELFKIEQYVEMVLSYLRMEDMSSDLSFETYPLDAIIKQAVRKYSQMFILKKIKLEYSPIEKMVLTDEKWLVFVLEQLLSNALKYIQPDGEDVYTPGNAHMTGGPGGKISIYMEDYAPKEREQDGQKLCLVIEDTGIGIWPEDLPRIFEKGFTGYNGRKDKKSTGIGLYLCKSVIDKLRHDIWIESEVGKGTKVYLFLARKTTRHE